MKNVKRESKNSGVGQAENKAGSQKRFRKDMILSIICFLCYCVSLIWVRFMDGAQELFDGAACGPELGREFFCIVSMFALIVVIGINYIMCVCGQTDAEAYDKISDMEVTQSNRRTAINERDMLLVTFKTKSFSKKVCRIIFCVEVVVCFGVYALLKWNIEMGKVATGVIIDLQTMVMAYLFYKNNHYRFKIEKKLNVK